jgi:hypothetical protein
VPGRRGRIAAGQQPETVVQPVQDVGHRQRAQPYRRQFQRERQAVQPRAQLGHGLAVRLGHGEARQDLGGPLGEQPHPVARHRQRRQRQQPLPGDAQGAAARGEHPQGRRPAQQLGHQRRALGTDPVGAVDHEQQFAIRDVLRKGRARAARGVVRHPQGVGDRVVEEFGVPQCRQVHRADAVAETVLCGARGTQGQPGLADATGAGHRGQPAGRQQFGQVGEFAVAADESGELGREAFRG